MRTESEKKENQGSLIYQKMANILKDCKAITKSEKNQQQGFKFRGIDNVMNELHELFARNEVFILQDVKSFETENRQLKSGSMITYTRATITFRYTTTDGSFVETTNVGEAMDTGDKGMNKAMSIALKYSLLQMFLIPTEEQKDPDATTPEETDFKKNAMNDIENATDMKGLMKVWNKYPTLQKDSEFVNSMTEKKNILKS